MHTVSTISTNESPKIRSTENRRASEVLNLKVIRAGSDWLLWVRNLVRNIETVNSKKQKGQTR